MTSPVPNSAFPIPRSSFRVPHSALLLLGPTGAGKSPLGDCMESSGFQGHRCVHLDFGAELRAVAAGRICPGLTQDDRVVVHESLQTGALLENDTFHIAAAIVEAFCAGKGLKKDEVVVLNGLPRHVDQAKDVDELFEVRWVIFLSCSPEVVLERIRLNSGGDRTGRQDDDLEFVRRKLNIFRSRTAPILDHYRDKGVRIESVTVNVDTGPEEILAKLG